MSSILTYVIFFYFHTATLKLEKFIHCGIKITLMIQKIFLNISLREPLSFSVLSIKLFRGRLIVGLPCLINLSGKWEETYPKLSGYILMDQFFTCTIYVAGQVWITLIVITGDWIASCYPSFVLLSVFVIIYWTKFLIGLYESSRKEYLSWLLIYTSFFVFFI